MPLSQHHRKELFTWINFLSEQEFINYTAKIYNLFSWQLSLRDYMFLSLLRQTVPDWDSVSVVLVWEVRSALKYQGPTPGLQSHQASCLIESDPSL